MADFCALIDKNAPPNHPNVKTMPKSSSCEDLGIVLTFGRNGCFGCVLSAQKCEKNYLDRVPSYFFSETYCDFP